MGGAHRSDLRSRFIRFVGTVVILLTLSGCFVSNQPLVAESDARFPWPTGTRLERLDGEGAPVALRKVGGYYVMEEADGTEIHTFRMRPTSGGIYLVMNHSPEDAFPFMYGLARVEGSDVEVFYADGGDLEAYLTRLSAADPGRARSIVSQLVLHDMVFEVASLSALEALLPDMLRQGFVTTQAAYRVVQDDGRPPPADRAAPTSELDAAIARATADLVDELRHGKWAREEDGFRSLRIEFYTRAIFGYSVSDDGSDCIFHFWREERTDDMLNRAHDWSCDGTIDAVLRFADDDYAVRPASEQEKRFLAYYLPRYAALFRAANDYKSFNPGTGRLALLPDLDAMAENSGLLQRIVDAASRTSLMAVRREGDPRPTPDEILMNVWVNDGAEEGGFEVGFTADRVGETGLRDCFVSAADPNGEESSLDADCDGTPEGWSDARGSRAVSAVGNEKVAQSLLLDIARFADVANAMFPRGEIVGDP